MRGLSIVLIAITTVAVVGCASGKLAPDATPDASTIDAMPDACVPATETCNGKDDDCDGKVDEEFTTLGTDCTEGTGACTVTGKPVCTADGTGVEASKKAGDGTDEKCDGIDNDCDGKTDEDFALGTPCDGPDADLCAEGVIACNGAGGTMCTDSSGDNLETCNVM